MIYTPLTRAAARLAYDAHAGQTDKSGLPYIFHPWHLAEQMTDEESCAAALLHDVAEDTSVTLEDLKAAGIPPRVLEAVRLLTHDKGVPYLSYVHALAPNDIARKVKLADIAHNSDTTRLDTLPAGAEQKLALYRQAAEFLRGWDETACREQKR